MFHFHKLWLFILLFCALESRAETQTHGRLDLSSEDLRQTSSLLLNEDIWLLEPEGMDFSAKDPVFQKGTHPRHFIKDPKILPGADSATFRLTVQLNKKVPLSLMVPEYPFYELYLGDRLLVKHGHSPDQPQRLYREVFLGEGDVFPIRIKVQRQADFWPPYTIFRLGLQDTIQKTQKMTEFYGVFFLGLIVISALYHFALACIIPGNRQSLYFALFLVCLGLRASLSAADQILIRIYPDFSWEWSWKLGFMGYFLSLPTFLAFLGAMFPRTIPRYASNIVWGCAALISAVTLITSVDVYSRLTNYYHLLTFVTLGLGLRSFVRAFRLRMPGVKPLLGTVVMLTVAVINDVLVVSYLLQTRPILDFALMAFIFSQTVIISYNYAHSFRDIVHTHKQLQKLVYTHVVTQIAAGRNLEETMPVATREAVVLSFDVIGSSHIKHPQFLRALEHLMASCQQILHEGYDPVRVAARGYRIKEMGDGLLASVGFPLANPDGAKESNADTALKMAVRFCEVFRLEMEKLQYHEPLYCSVGITQGMIEGFFPGSGIKQYDVRGRALILATRYESMRNIVFKVTDEISSLIFIQDEVYKALSPALQQDFERWDCLQKGHRIRDDVHAVQAWYRRLPGTTPARSQGATVASNDSMGPGPRAVS
ncbi:MAG TPA: 7TM diverse intracellular signaling domain-containing protein [Oligoflexus sp.]|uniref:7TM diverse intracellular signaling domain-containing protein n=1 Tax=Oligoflexus sp. TaxID=1971216 RepID=UPI002D8085D6|nr:7TM diverse intracellular signaling domain-containing protein [Oligoflexus sp.]HET9239109.1 7TM diverse intracellular signaling domain-containing protein [Oligoflexus sp.]